MIDIVVVTDMQGAFFVLFGGMLVASLMLAGEHLYFKGTNKKRESPGFTP